MLSGMLFQLNWNIVPTYPEQESNLAVTRRKLNKLITRAYSIMGISVADVPQRGSDNPG